MIKGMEALEITDAMMAEHGLANVGPAFSVSCENHGGPGLVLCRNGMQVQGNGS